MNEKYNFKIDPANNTVSIIISPSIFPRPVILHAAYHFIEEGKVIVEGEDEMIKVTLIPEKKVQGSDLEELAYEFNIQLISSFVEGEESRKHAEIRETMMKAALSSPTRPSSQRPPAETSQSEKQPKEGN